MDGNLLIMTDLYSNSEFHIGDFGHGDARGTAVISSTGYVYAGSRVLIMGINMPGWGDSGGTTKFDYGSSLTVDGGRLTFVRGVRLYSPCATRNGTNLAATLRIKGGANIVQEAAGGNYFDIEGGGVLEIDGGDASINIRALNVTGGADCDGNDNPAVIKFTGNGISTINNSGATTFGSLSFIDLSELAVPSRTYTLISSSNITDGGVQPTPESVDWSLNVTATTVEVTYTGGGPTVYLLTVNSGAGNGSHDPNSVVGVSANAPDPGDVFDAWTGDVSYVAVPGDANTTVTMPAQDITITATYQIESNLTILERTVPGSSSDAIEYVSNDVVNIYGTGMEFKPSEKKCLAVRFADVTVPQGTSIDTHISSL